MPCFPGFFPVMKEVHAGGVIGGTIEASRPDAPVPIRCAMFGSLPSATQGLIRSRVAASRPTMRSLTFFIRLTGKRLESRPTDEDGAPFGMSLDSAGALASPPQAGFLLRHCIHVGAHEPNQAVEALSSFAIGSEVRCSCVDHSGC